MVAPYIGSYGFLGYAVESAFGSPIGATGYVPFIDVGLEKDPGLIEIKAARQQRELSVYYMPGEQKITGKITFPLFAVMGIDLVAAAIGALAGGNITQQNDLVSLTIEENLGGLASVQYAGCVVNKCVIKGATKSEATAECDVIAQQDAAISASTPTFTDDQPFVLAGTSVELFGSPDTTVESFEITIDNMVEAKYTYSGQRYPTYLPSKGRSVQLKIVESLQAMAYYNSLPLANATSVLANQAQTVTLASGAHSITFSFPQMTITKLAQPMKVGDVIMQDITLKAFLGSGSSTMSAVVA